MLIGAHVRLPNGYAAAARYASDVGAECMQVFAKSPQRWRAPSLPPAAVAAFLETRERFGMGPVYVHTAYLINLGSTDEALRQHSVAALADELRRGAELRASAVVTHIGTNASGVLEEGALRIARSVAEALQGVGDGVPRLLLENTAGAGTTFGGGFDELGAVFGRLDASGFDVGMCLDTCHAHAFGHDLTSAEGWTATLDGLEGCCGRERIGLVHANDCAFERGSRRDRHAWVGEGAIGEVGFTAMLCEARLAGVAAVIEMPGEPPEKDVVNLTRLKAWRAACAGSGAAS